MIATRPHAAAFLGLFRRIPPCAARSKMTDNLSAVLHGADDLRIEQQPFPKLLIRVSTVGICGSDEHFYRDGEIGKTPIILGHEAVGFVKQVGSEVEGDRVALEPGVPCRRCAQCKIGRYNLCSLVHFTGCPPDNGSLTRFVAHDADFCFKLPSQLSMEDGVLLQPLSVAVHACRRARLEAGQNVLILGAGPMGILCLLVAKAIGAAQIIVTDIDCKRLELAKRLGASSTLNVRDKIAASVKSEIVKAFGNVSPDVSIECSGTESAVETGITATKSGGILALVGIGKPKMEVPILDAMLREVDIIGVFRNANCTQRALDLVASGKIDLSELTRAHYSLEEAVKAFERFEKGDVMKVFIHCDGPKQDISKASEKIVFY